jgi:hypothetical protein
MASSKKTEIFRSFLELAILMQEALQEDSPYNQIDVWELRREVLQVCSRKF